MATHLNPESLTTTLSNPKSGAIAVVVFSNSYHPSVEFLGRVKEVLQDFPSIQLITINQDDHRHLFGLPILCVSEVPSLILFNRGKPFSQPIVDEFRATARLRRLAFHSMETDDFEAVGTCLKVAPEADLRRWKNSTTSASAKYESVIGDLLTPLWTVMESLYEI